MTRGDLKELLGCPPILAPELVDQGLVGGPRVERPNDVGVGDVG